MGKLSNVAVGDRVRIGYGTPLVAVRGTVGHVHDAIVSVVMDDGTDAIVLDGASGPLAVIGRRPERHCYSPVRVDVLDARQPIRMTALDVEVQPEAADDVWFGVAREHGGRTLSLRLVRDEDPIHGVMWSCTITLDEAGDSVAWTGTGTTPDDAYDTALLMTRSQRARDMYRELTAMEERAEAMRTTERTRVVRDEREDEYRELRAAGATDAEARSVMGL